MESLLGHEQQNCYKPSSITRTANTLDTGEDVSEEFNQSTSLNILVSGVFIL